MSGCDCEACGGVGSECPCLGLGVLDDVGSECGPGCRCGPECGNRLIQNGVAVRKNVTVAQVKQYCEMESHEEKLYRQMREDNIREAKDEMKRKANEIDKNKIIKNRGDNYKGGFGPLQSMGSGIFENSFNDTSISSNGTDSRLSSDVDSFSTKSKGFSLSKTIYCIIGYSKVDILCSESGKQRIILMDQESQEASILPSSLRSSRKNEAIHKLGC
ncbi:hypothetical protein Ahy_B06g083228 isoform E [Arachis hypogaea]|uniref:Coatomer subunit delta n=1 Tax=Arachis hypogaea TaxID=3818 RepID=A0A444YPF5_ARAHY|nr:hypothetical protein Ahy_B06g083228 isoform E [Arachis hypogaea]